MKRSILCWVISFFVLVFFGVSAHAADPVLVEKIVVDSEPIILPVGKTISVKASVMPKNATTKKLIWTSSDESIMTVNNGKIKGIACGEAIATISTTDESGINVSIKITVVQPVKKIILSDSKLSLAIGTHKQINGTVEPDNASIQDISWSSSNEKVATVDNSGVVIGKGKGNAKITATATDGSGVKASITVKVEEYDMVFVSKRPQEFSYRVRGGGLFEQTFSVKNGNVSIPNKDSSGWTSGGNWTETVEVTPLRPGTDVVTVKYNKDKLECKVFVADYFKERDIQYVPVPDTSPDASNGSFRDIVYGTPLSEVKDQLISQYGENYIITESTSGITIEFRGLRTSVAAHDVSSISFTFCYDEKNDGSICKDEDVTSFYRAEYVFENKPNESSARDLYTKLCELYGDTYHRFEEASDHSWNDNQTSIYLYNNDYNGVKIVYQWSPGWRKAIELVGIASYLKEVEEQKAKEEEQQSFSPTVDGL